MRGRGRAVAVAGWPDGQSIGRGRMAGPWPDGRVAGLAGALAWPVAGGRGRMAGWPWRVRGRGRMAGMGRGGRHTSGPDDLL